MKIELDLNKCDVNISGEILRDLVFMQDDNHFGCYSTFDIRPEFKNVDKSDSRIQHFWRLMFGSFFDIDDVKDEIRKTTIVENDKVIAAWWWDGDGVLLIMTKEDGVVYLNDDCKKDYVWERVTDLDKQFGL